MTDFLQQRLDGVRHALAAREIAALLISHIGNIGYVTGFSGSTAYALITGQEALFITDPRYTLRAQKECPHFQILQAAGSGGYPEALKEALEGRPEMRRIGFEASHVTVAQWENLKKNNESREWVDTENVIEDLRLLKDADEIARIRRAITVAEDAWETVKPMLRPGIRERDVALELEFTMRRAGAEAVAFETIVASGALGAHPHHRAGERPLAAGDLVTVDWGACLNDYVSDITRTVGIETVTDEQRKIFGIVLEAQRRAIAAITPGKNGKEIDAVARDYIASHGYGEAFGHSLGHSIGRHVHDGPGLSVRGEKFILKPGMVLTVEPGIYLEGWGGVRIEEDILVTAGGCEILTRLPNELEVLG